MSTKQRGIDGNIASPVPNKLFGEVVYIGGMNDGYLSSGYLPKLAERLPNNYCLVQPLVT